MFIKLWSWIKSLFVKKPYALPAEPNLNDDLPKISPAKVIDITTDTNLDKDLQKKIDQAPWMQWMMSHIGEDEKTGSKATPFNLKIFSHTNYALKDGIMEPGCAATVCAALEETGYKSTDSASADSYDNYGIKCDLKYGAIVRFEWENGGHHVSFFVKGNDDGTICCLGGNQHSKLDYANYSPKYIKAIRWPVK